MNLPFELQAHILSFLSLRTSLQISRVVKDSIIAMATDKDYYTDYCEIRELLFSIELYAYGSMVLYCNGSVHRFRIEHYRKNSNYRFIDIFNTVC